MQDATSLNLLNWMQLLLGFTFLLLLIRKRLLDLSELACSYLLINLIGYLGAGIMDLVGSPQFGNILLSAMYLFGLLVLIFMLIRVKVRATEFLLSWAFASAGLLWVRSGAMMASAVVFGFILTIYGVFLRRTWRVFTYRGRSYFRSIHMVQILFVLVLFKYLGGWFTWIGGRLLDPNTMTSVSTISSVCIMAYLVIHTLRLPRLVREPSTESGAAWWIPKRFRSTALQEASRLSLRGTVARATETGAL